ncbi:hypothetical protein NTG1052_130048 [Candidatus Nitrotoga sp. 1052]|nr:hypothetical protein NTG1052_130048 [Candidatus Nitrotoga sp. 1052]
MLPKSNAGSDPSGTEKLRLSRYYPARGTDAAAALKKFRLLKISDTLTC